MITDIPIEDIIYMTLLIITIVISVIAIRMKDLLYAVILLGIVDLALAAIFLMLAAPDIAITQAAVTAGLGTFIFMITIYKTERREKP